MMRWVLLVLAGAILAGGCASRPAGDPATRPALSGAQDIPGVGNFAQVSPQLYRGAQPSAEGFSELKRRGIKTVVNMRDSFDDRPMMAGLGLKYVEIPSTAWTIGDDEISRFLKVVEDPANQPVFVHCHRGADRTGCAVAAYRLVIDGWTPEEAAGEMKLFDHNWLYLGIDFYVKRLDPAAMKQRVEATEKPSANVVP